MIARAAPSRDTEPVADAEFREDLAKFLCASFERGELRGLARRVDGDELERAVDWDGADQQVVDRLVKALLDRGTQPLWAPLRAARPHKVAEIERLRERSGDPADDRATPPAPPPAPLTPTRRWLAAALACAFTLAALGLALHVGRVGPAPAAAADPPLAPEAIVVIETDGRVAAALVVLLREAQGASAGREEIGSYREPPRTGAGLRLHIDAREPARAQVRVGAQLDFLSASTLTLDLSDATGNEALPILYGLAWIDRLDVAALVDPCSQKVPRAPREIHLLLGLLAEIGQCPRFPLTRAELQSFLTGTGWARRLAERFMLAQGWRPPEAVLKDTECDDQEPICRSTRLLAAGMLCRTRPADQRPALDDALRGAASAPHNACERAAWEVVRDCLALWRGDEVRPRTCDDWPACHACAQVPVKASLLADLALVHGRAGRWTQAAQIYDAAVALEASPPRVLAAAEAWLHADLPQRAQAHLDSLPPAPGPDLVLRRAVLDYILRPGAATRRALVEANAACAAGCGWRRDPDLERRCPATGPCWLAEVGRPGLGEALPPA